MTDLPLRTWNGLVIPMPGTFTLDPAHRRLGFQVTHMMVSAVRGEFAEGTAAVRVAEDPMQSQVVARIRADSITTHNPDRDAHLRSADFLDVAHHPTIEFVSTRLDWKAPEADPIFAWARLKGRTPGRVATPEPAQSTAFVVHGDLTIRGVTRPITLDAEYGGARRAPTGEDVFGFSATGELDREEFGLRWNVALEAGGVLVARTVRIELAGEAVRDPG
ncbi:YceI family protein [Puerhibacterium puerhi]|uniref:YceI family protein n=1 Tax=Puerhibacterium puerhi TaxID=2692623 RepID=UPI00135BD321|nr:YceI family protein [Puerhibacterium puerhi]